MPVRSCERTGILLLRHLRPLDAVEESPDISLSDILAALVMRVPLLEEERCTGANALVAQVARPCGTHRPGLVADLRRAMVRDSQAEAARNRRLREQGDVEGEAFPVHRPMERHDSPIQVEREVLPKGAREMPAVTGSLPPCRLIPNSYFLRPVLRNTSTHRSPINPCWDSGRPRL